jgi:uncharacterized protein (TIGR03790 family)
VPQDGRVCSESLTVRRLAARWFGSLALLAALSTLRGDPAIAPGNLWGVEDPSRGPLDRRHLALVINTADPLSESIGRLYQTARRLPDNQVIRVRFEAGVSTLDPASFRVLKREVDRRTPRHVQVYALAWAAPYRVGCQSITSAFAFGIDPRLCADECRSTSLNPYYARGDVRRPWDALRMRPAMLLAATRLSEARALIARGVASDGTSPPGTAYLLSTSDSKRNSRAFSYGRVAAAVGKGFRVKLLHSDSLEGAKDVMAYFTGLAKVHAIASNRYRPGAVADHLTSFGGQLTDSPQMSALRWLEAGATGSYGTVVEPCNFPAKFPDPALVLAYYSRGDTLIEAYWRSVAMPGQGVFIGEPLARPWPGGVSGSVVVDARPRHAR